MDAQERRAALAGCLEETEQPVSAGALAARFGVSRQIIVGDIALLRAGGLSVSATPRGYLLPRDRAGFLRTAACLHSPEEMGQELEIMVDNGCVVEDVVVEHPVYGQLTGQLHLASRYDIRQFLDKVSASEAKPLAELTAGVHLHTLRCPDRQAYHRVLEQLRQAGFLYQ